MPMGTGDQDTLQAGNRIMYINYGNPIPVITTHHTPLPPPQPNKYFFTGRTISPIAVSPTWMDVPIGNNDTLSCQEMLVPQDGRTYWWVPFDETGIPSRKDPGSINQWPKMAAACVCGIDLTPSEACVFIMDEGVCDLRNPAQGTCESVCKIWQVLMPIDPNLDMVPDAHIDYGYLLIAAEAINVNGTLYQ